MATSLNDFEISTDNFDPSSLRKPVPNHPAEPATSSAPVENVTHSAPAPVTESVRREPSQASQRTATKKTESRQSAPISQSKSESNEPTETFIDNVKYFFGDGRFRIFIGLLLTFLAGYMLIVSISFLSTGGDDQSIVHGREIEDIAAEHDGVRNSGGWFGAFLSHLLIYRWLGIGSFIFILYVGAVGIGLVRGKGLHFWQLSFKSIISAIALSVIAGFVTYGMTNPTFWGGEHGFYINNLLFANASVWAALGVSLLLASLVILIFLKPLSRVWRSISGRIRAYRARLVARHEEALRAAAVNKATVEESASTSGSTATVNDSAHAEPQVCSGESSVATETESSQVNAPVVTTTVSQSPTPFDADFYKTENDENIAPEMTLEDIPSPMPRVEVPQFESTPIKINTIDAPAETVESPLTEPATEDHPVVVMDDEPTVITGETKVVEYDTPEVELVDEPSVDSGKNSDIVLEINNPDINESDETEEESETIMTDATDIMQPSHMTDCYDPRADLSHYVFPGLDLLRIDDTPGISIDVVEQEENKQRIINSLQSYGIAIDKITATIGPTITLYEIVPAAGVRIAKIKRLGDDLAMSLSALGIRIIAPMPGKGTIGMEVPNKNPQTVNISTILNSKAYRESKAALPIAMGTTISKDVYVTDLAKMPHLLVAGATGMGKSVGLNTIIASLLFKKHPAELKFVLVDPKVVEFSLYRVLERHFLAKLPDEERPIITESDKVAATLNSLCIEMENRYQLLSDAGLRTIAEYNEKFMARRLNPEKGHRYMPYIVVIIDEFGDLILTAGKEIETPISRIAAKARAVGIHMILATQRPSVNVITGVIKANFPGRMAFRVTSRIDSQTILDRNGADQLVGRGDMLISKDGVIERVQCAYIDTDEVERLCSFIARQQAYPSAYPLPEFMPTSENGGTGPSMSDRDPLFIDAGYLIIDSGVGSTSSIQRKFEIGYPRAGKIMDQLEMAGVVGPAQGGKARKVLMDRITFQMTYDS